MNARCTGVGCTFSCTNTGAERTALYPCHHCIRDDRYDLCYELCMSIAAVVGCTCPASSARVCRELGPSWPRWSDGHGPSMSAVCLVLSRSAGNVKGACDQLPETKYIWRKGAPLGGQMSPRSVDRQTPQLLSPNVHLLARPSAPSSGRVLYTSSTQPRLPVPLFVLSTPA